MGRPRKRRRQEDDEPVHEQVDDSRLSGLDAAFSDGAFPDFPLDFIGNTAAQDNPYATFDITSAPGLDAFPPDLFDDVRAPVKESPATQVHQHDPAHIIDPSLNGDGSSSSAAESPPSKCTCYCLSTMFSASSELQKDYWFIGFPRVLSPLKSAMSKAEDILRCDVCPNEKLKYRENTMLLITLLGYICTAFERLLREIDTKASEMAAQGKRGELRMGIPLTAENAGLHTGKPDCPMGMDLSLDPPEWRRLLFQATRNEAFSRGDGRLTLESLLDRLNARMEAWHSASGYIHIGNSCACVHMTSMIRKSLDQLPK